MVVTSDPIRKQDDRPIDEEAATRTVRRVVPRYYTRIVGSYMTKTTPSVMKLDGNVPAAGMMANDDLPPHCLYLHAVDGTKTVDYTGLLAELWASTRHVHRRLNQG